MSTLILDDSSNWRTSTARTRPFVTTAAKLQDTRRLVDIEFSAFENEQVNQVLSFRDYKKPAHFERSVLAYRKALIAEGVEDECLAKGASVQPISAEVPLAQAPQVKFKKIVHTASNEIISFARIEMKRYTPDELHSPLDSGHEEEPRMNRDWFALNERLRREYVGLEEHCYIGMLATAPRHQNHGAGTMLLQEILAEADEAGVEVYLEATDTAKPLYERREFEAIRELRFDPGQYGMEGLGVEKQTVMVRGALGCDGGRRMVRSWEDAVAHTRAQLQDT